MAEFPEAPAASPPGARDRGTRLDSWKEIAAYLQRDVRTLQRWEPPAASTAAPSSPASLRREGQACRTICDMTADFLGARLAAQGEALERLVSRTSAEHFERRPQADKWSAREHLAHLACYQQRFLERLRAILSRDRPSFQRYRAEEDEDWPEWQRLASDEIHERLQARRRELLTVVASLSESQLERVGLHPVFGAMTIPQWIDFFLFHEGHHAYQVMALAMRGSSSARLTTPGRRGI